MNTATRFVLREFFFNKNTPGWMTRTPGRLAFAGIFWLILGAVCWVVTDNTVPGLFLRATGVVMFLCAAGCFVRGLIGEVRVREIQSKLDAAKGAGRE